ncbi:ICMT-domain-containing protein [Gloeophyllum trabeum ATCC 11539]|uniref:Protein-S-isoprenylcysteine O-methyltransferase n=1 Tax=Gloeophyllum trabeum (strain ATCC 11539 / FP-39264 / Madison 617) TaxID=670483 RepID=S7QAN8_GLOTA|nr:ICMT-domain-containing protein [Gloeophyllum trabeum ATCC 11539]EPQ56976.1 ICMT-domain-containing protein [Gloeophyllum trabeum ATCC 11539]
MSLLRAPLVLLSAFGIHYSLTPPNPPPPDEERERYKTPEIKLTKIIMLWPMSLKAAFWAGGLCETALILAHKFPAHPLSQRVLSTLLPSGAAPAGALTLTPALFAGTALALFGTYLRGACFRTLGKLFTFELAIRKDHRLVTEGPYSFVRHPSYTAGLLTFVGVNFVFFGPGSWFWECGVAHTRAGQVFSAAVALNAVWTVGFIAQRTVVEDRTLREQFGAQWDEWAARVPYRLFPFIF